MTQQSAAEQLFVGNSEMARLMRSHDWSQTRLGPISNWASSLKIAVSICLNSRFPMVIWWGRELVLLYNDAWRPILGTKHPNALGRTGQEVWSEIWDIIGAQLKGVLETAQATWSEDMLLLVDRYGYTEEAYFTYSYSPIFLETGVVGGAFTAVTETTRRVIGERRLSTLRELAASTVEAKSVEEACLIASTTLATNPYDIPFALLYLVEQNGSQARLVGTVRVEAGTVASPEQVDLTQAQDDWKFAQVKTSGEAELVDQLVTRFGVISGGSWAEPTHSAIVLPIAQAGQKQHLSGLLVLGISPRLAFDDEYQGFFDLVVNNVATAIANAQTYQEERKRAEALAELDRAKTLFFTNVSHEFRTPLTLILSPLEELLITLKERLQPNEREQLNLMQRNGLRLQKLVNTLLDFSRIEAGRLQAAYEPIDLATYTAELASAFRSLIEQAGMTLVVECPPFPEVVYVDRAMWEKIVFNLLSNAFKFTLSGSITVRSEWCETYVQLSISDTGVGIPASALPHLFERFQRVENSQGRSFEGSGIGLSLVQELVKLHSGTIDVTSVVGQGSCFTISIPTGTAHLPSERIGESYTPSSMTLGAMPYVEEAQRWLPQQSFEFSAMQVELERQLEESESTQNSTSKPQNLQTARILLADDNADMRGYIQRLLSSTYIVETVADGVAALKAIQDNPPDLVLSDVMMPRLDGFELLQALRADPQTKELPIILLSARAGEESRLEGLAAGADDYLIKPFSAHELLVRVESNLKLTQLRRQAMQREQALRLEAETAKQSVETILSSINDGFYVLDRDWCFTYVNDRYCQMVDMQPSMLLGQNIWELFPLAVGTEAYSQFQRAIDAQTPLQFDYLYTPWNSWYDNRIYPSSRGLTVFLADITDRKCAEAELRQKNAILDVINQSAPTPIFVKDRQGRIIYANPATLEVLGKSAAEVIGYRDDDLYPSPEDAALVMENDQRIMESEQLEVVEESPDGIRTFLGMKVPYRNEAGEVIGLIGISNDITDRVQLERDRERLLRQEKMAREQAETANRIKDEFLAILSHELRTPMNPILGWSSLLRQGKLDATKVAYAIQTIERNAKLQVQLIDDLLDISRILRGKLVLNMLPVDLRFVINAALETVRLGIDTKAIALQTDLDSTVEPVIGDAGRLQQVVWNLLSNALKFTPEGGQVKVRLSAVTGHDSLLAAEQLKPSDQNQMTSYAQIQVTDTGKGIHPDFLPYVFEHFRQEDAATTRKFGGLGLGLAIARQIVELHGGKVEVTSDGEGQGATFTVKLPLGRSGSLRAREQQSTEPAIPQLRHSPLTGLRILIIDDEADSRELVGFVLEQAGATVTSVAAGIEALRIVNQSVPSLIVSDIGMPEMDGYMLMRQIRALEPASQVPAIALTAYAGEFDQQQAIAAGFQQHLPKPVDPEQLVSAIRALCNPAADSS